MYKLWIMLNNNKKKIEGNSMKKVINYTLEDFNDILDDEIKNKDFKRFFIKKSFKLDVVNTVRELREEQNLSQQKFTDKISVSKINDYTY